MSDTTPILLRPRTALADAMADAAAARGISRQAWMLTVLEGACSEYVSALTPDDVPLFAAAPCDECRRSGFGDPCASRDENGADTPCPAWGAR